MNISYPEDLYRTVWWVEGARRLTGMTRPEFHRRVISADHIVRSSTLEALTRGARALPLRKKSATAERYFFAVAQVEPRSMALFFEAMFAIIEELRWWSEPNLARKLFLNRCKRESELAFNWAMKGRPSSGDVCAFSASDFKSFDRSRRIHFAMVRSSATRSVCFEQTANDSNALVRRLDADREYAICDIATPSVEAFTLALALATEAMALGDMKRRAALVPLVHRHGTALQSTPIKRWANELLTTSLQRLTYEDEGVFVLISAFDLKAQKPVQRDSARIVIFYWQGFSLMC